MNLADRRRRILLVDDEEDMRLTIGTILEAAGHELETAVDGPDALEKVPRFRPDVILLDVMMPAMNGYDVCTRLQQDELTSWIPVIFVTSLDAEQDKAKALALGAVDYVVKPGDVDRLPDKLQALAAITERWQELQLPTTSPGPARPSSDFARFKSFLMERARHDERARASLPNLALHNLYTLPSEAGLTPEDVAKAVADFLNVRFLPSIASSDLKLGVLPTTFCRSNQLVMLENGSGKVQVALSNPFDLPLMDTLRRGNYLAGSSDIAIAEPRTIQRLFETVVPATISLDDEQQPPEIEESINVLEASARKGPVVSTANALIARAIQAGASDIHLQPMGRTLGVRFRIDGILQDRESIDGKLQAALLSRFKVMASLDIAERRKPQDGRIRIRYEDRPIDLRVSTLPAYYGEKIVLRVLDQSTFRDSLDGLGFEEEELRRFRERIRKPHGILLATGPTGSGKTTTLYAALQELNRPQVNIVTVEDPIECALDRVTQVQVHPEAERTFAAALRSILRQDPDVIMIGELRDSETLEIAFQAALTGHLVLSTLHTNDAASAVTRLVHMGVEPYLVASTLELVVAQRLLRRLCAHCRTRTEAPQVALESESARATADGCFYEAGSCERCNYTGYRGRLPVAELMPVDAGLRGLITRRADADALRSHAREACGTASLREDALRKAARGLTSMEEVLRLT